MNPRMLPVKHFENVLFHSLSPYDYQLRLKKSVTVKMFTTLREHADDISLIKPVKNDQLYALFSDADDFKFKDFIVSLKTYPEKFKMVIPSRQFVMSQKPKVQKCKDCQSVSTDDFVKLETQPIIEQYEPEDKESLMSIYCDVLRFMPFLDKAKNVQF